ncbi:hypothetical protein Cylst_4370 [Cylindrospermum stagnale PCC 7417]|uniref:Knr4/Smi1-like domain-containing protein n=1 Tax=Cylindrospermum stagnale PCC 7417 TaxID=56107 RepID=K9X318_9NOST|nr:hypothetical protein [Cylindrospermum stagnale]AFZ26461.1 hypothetical protein Cylst_4370 [Cylindrospermum stagnale PCC 7417]
MNFEQYIQKMQLIFREMEVSEQYDLSYEISRPATDIGEFEEIIAEEHGIDGFHIWEPFKKFYQVTSGFTFRWRYLNSTNENYSTNGMANINLIFLIYEPEEQISGEFNLFAGYRILDFIGDEELEKDNYVAVKFFDDRDEPDLYYYSIDTDSYYKMSIGFEEYMNLLLECRALYPWQELFISDKNFILDSNRIQQFLADIIFLFPDIDISKFCQNIK